MTKTIVDTKTNVRAEEFRHFGETARCTLELIILLPPLPCLDSDTRTTLAFLAVKQVYANECFLEISFYRLCYIMVITQILTKFCSIDCSAS